MGCLLVSPLSDVEDSIGILPWRSPDLSDANAVRTLVANSGFYGNDLNFANMYLLRHKHRITLCFHRGFLLRHYAGVFRSGYGYPIGQGDLAEVLAVLEQDSRARGEDLTFCMVTDDQKESLIRQRPGQFRFSVNKGDDDYIYDRSQLARLSGRAYHRKRNYFTRFASTFPVWHWKPLSQENRADAILVAQRWFDDHNGNENAQLVAEQEALEQAASHLSLLELLGGLVYVADRPVALSMASATSPDVLDVHFEKADPEFYLAATVVCSETARALSSFRWVNREEDLNLPGLRESKQSWFPVERLVKSSAFFLNRADPACVPSLSTPSLSTSPSSTSPSSVSPSSPVLRRL